jgi:DNA-binding ferritin-like protein (Dps family)
MKIIEKLVGNMDEKRAYREYKKSVAALPREYNIVMTEIQNYMWSGAPGSGVLDGGLEILYDVLNLFEISAAEGQSVLDVTGNDVTAFCDELVREWHSRTWQDVMRNKFNSRIHEKLEELKNGGN